VSARTSSVAPGERTRLPEDIGARRRIAEDLETTLFVQAAAGSGKTGALVARVVALIDGGRAELREIAAITFTEAAATELRTRVATALADPIASDAGGVVAGRRADALLQLDEAAMTTIHGFAQRLLTEHPIEAGLPLRFDVADERTASLVRQERFDAFIDTLFDDESARDLLGAAQILGVTPEHFRALSDQMSERFDPGERPSTPADGLRVVVRECVGTVRAAGAECLDHRGGCPDPDDRLRVRLDRLAGALDDPLLDRADEDAWLGALAWLVALPGESRGKVGRATSWAPGRIEDAREALREYDEARAAGLAAVWDRVLGEIGGRLREEAARFADERRAVGSLFFSDLLVLGYEVLASSPAVREDARARYRYLLVDEFQDTDPLQFQMLTLLGGEGGTGALSGGRLFFVGDPMQSIYRFRGADVARYRAVRDAVGVDATVELTTNFRSAPEICTAVSEIFAKLVEGPDAATVRLRPFRQDDPRTRVWRIGHGDAERSVGERRAEEATAIVEALRALVDSGATVVDEGSARPVAYGDVAVLVPARTGMATLVRAFTLAGIDVRLTESALVYDAEEVADLVTVLRAIEDRGEESDVGAADGDLFDLRSTAARPCRGRWAVGPRAHLPSAWFEDRRRGTRDPRRVRRSPGVTRRSPTPRPGRDAPRAHRPLSGAGDRGERSGRRGRTFPDRVPHRSGPSVRGGRGAHGRRSPSVLRAREATPGAGARSGASRRAPGRRAHPHDPRREGPRVPRRRARRARSHDRGARETPRPDRRGRADRGRARRGPGDAWVSQLRRPERGRRRRRSPPCALRRRDPGA
jgi:superfamily I DNA/RNA helicase